MYEPADQYAGLTAIEIVRLGLERAQSQQTTQALAAVHYAIAMSPDDVTINHTAGVIFREIHMNGDALGYFENAIAIDPSFFFSHVEIAHIFMADGRLTEALDWFKKPIAAGTNWHVPYEKAGLLANFLGRHDEAVQYLETASQLAHGDERVRESAEACRQSASMAQHTIDLNRKLASKPAVTTGKSRNGQIVSSSIWSRVRFVRVEFFPRSGAAFDEVVEVLAFGLRDLGALVDITFNQPLEEYGVNIFVGAHMILFCPGFPPIPDNSIILNLEPYSSPSFQYDHYKNIMRKFPVWEYSEKNLALMKNDFQNVIKLEIGHTRQMSRIFSKDNKDIDVLFYGSLNDRRRHIITKLEQAGLRVVCIFGKFGIDRDSYIKRSKIVLNIHFYGDSIFEIVRISYLLSNQKAVVCEIGADTEVPEGLRDAVIGRQYDELVEACVSIVQSDLIRIEAEVRGYDLFSRRDQAALLADAIGRTSWSSGPT